MEASRVTMTDTPSRDDRDFLDERIYEYNVATTGITDGRLLMLTVRDEQGAIIAGLSGWTWGHCMEIEYLWVREDRRGQGLGTHLLAAAEAEGTARGCAQVVLDTHSFQAPDFYTKHGYAVYGVVDGYPRGFSHLHLRKQLPGASTPD